MKLFLSITVFLLLSAAISLAAEGDFLASDLAQPDNTIFLDRSGRMLRFIPDAKGERHLYAEDDEINDYLKGAFIAIEDKRFYSHGGFDPIAIGRAVKDNLLHMRTVSGASTISQQTVRLIYPRRRDLWGKITEIARSVKLEGILDKKEILLQYLNRVPMGNNISGVGLAARVYFGKGPKDLSPAEAAVLGSLPKAPSLYNPYGGRRDLLMKRKDRVLHEMARQGYLSEDELREALAYEISFNEKTPFPNMAPHLTEMLLERRGRSGGIMRITIDIDLQRSIESILLSHRGRIKSRGGTQAAAIVVHNLTMDVLALAGSFSYSAEDKGYNNGAIALRSAGSTIKPFLYAGALDQGYTASSVLQDVLRRYKTPLGDYSPDNFDRRQYGPVTVRAALGNSLNISAVRMLESLELTDMYETLKRLGLINDPEKGAGHYGLGLVIGNIEVTLEELAAAYSSLANGGIYRPLRYFMDDGRPEGDRIFSEEAAYIIGDILSDPAARVLTFGGLRQFDFPFRVSLKTGTSTRYRDAWAVGYTPEYTVAVWVGHFDGTPTNMLTGASSAGPIMGEIMMHLHADRYPSSFRPPEGVVTAEVCGISGMKPGRLCTHVTRELFIRGSEPVETCTFHENERYFHELPVPYAGWVFERSSRRQGGNYRLSGVSPDIEGSSEAWDIERPPMLQGIRVDISRRAEGGPKEGHVDESSGGPAHLRIGAADAAPGLSHSDNSLRIIYPLPGDRFLVSEEASRQVRLESVSSSSIGYVDWFVDGRHIGRAGPPYSALWEAERGRHIIIAVGPDNTGDLVTITVE